MPLLIVAIALSAIRTAAFPWPPTARERAASLVARMTLPEKLSLLMGSEVGT